MDGAALRAVPPLNTALDGMCAYRCRLPFGIAVRQYWPWLVGITLFGPAVFILSQLGEVPDTLLFVAFFAVSGLAMYPCLFRDAPYTFWLLACVLYVGPGMLVVLAALVLQRLLGTGL